jgi:myo-inositol-1(or 4)-monophosphatase
MSEADELRSLAVEIAKGAGELLLSTKGGVTTSKSSPTDLVTDADRAAEKFIVERIKEARPADSILAEEGSLHEGTSGVRWVIDPLDGTINFVYGFPQWCVSIGIEGNARVGVVHDPTRGEIFTDADDLSPSTKTDLSDALIGTGFSYSSEMRSKQAKLLTKILPLVRDIRRAGSCALDLTWVAAGRLDGFYENDTHQWDISAGLAIIEAVGGHTRTHGQLTIAAGRLELLEQLEALVLEEHS